MGIVLSWRRSRTRKGMGVKVFFRSLVSHGVGEFEQLLEDFAVSPYCTKVGNRRGNGNRHRE